MKGPLHALPSRASLLRVARLIFTLQQLHRLDIGTRLVITLADHVPCLVRQDKLSLCEWHGVEHCCVDNRNPLITDGEHGVGAHDVILDS
jgi:hypothetical protein